MAVMNEMELAWAFFLSQAIERNGRDKGELKGGRCKPGDLQQYRVGKIGDWMEQVNT